MATDMSHAVPDDRLPRPLAITFVHGTWGRGFFPRAGERDRWFETDGRFRKILVAALATHGFHDVTTSAHPWSGANSVLQRDVAAAALAIELDRQIDERPDALRLVVAHSHGGNVALRSFVYLKRDPRDIAVVTLATPFVELFRSNAPAFRWITPGDLLVALVVCLTILQTIVFPADDDTRFFASLIATGVFLVVVLLWKERLDKAERHPKALLHNPDTTKLIRCADHGAFRRLAPATVVLRGVDDEAALVLAAGAIASRLGGIGIVTAVRIAKLLVIPGGLTFFGRIVMKILEPFTGIDPDDYLAQVVLPVAEAVFAIPLVVLWIVAALIVLWRSANAVYGRELFVRSHKVDISTNSCPDLAGHVRVVTLRDSRKARSGLRHAIYNHPDCIDTIVDAVAKLVNGTPAPPRER